MLIAVLRAQSFAILGSRESNFSGIFYILNNVLLTQSFVLSDLHWLWVLWTLPWVYSNPSHGPELSGLSDAFTGISAGRKLLLGLLDKKQQCLRNTLTGVQDQGQQPRTKLLAVPSSLRLPGAVWAFCCHKPELPSYEYNTHYVGCACTVTWNLWMMYVCMYVSYE